MSKSYISNLSFYSYSPTHEGSGSVSISTEGEPTVITIQLDEYAKDEIKAAIDNLLKRQQRKAADFIAAASVRPQLTYEDRSEAYEHENLIIDAKEADEEVPF